MKLTHLLAASLLPAGLLAVTVDPHDGGIRRQGLSCTVVASEVNCRSGPGTEFDVVTSLKKGFVGTFDCAKTGECIVLNGMKNCGWDRIEISGKTCYVTGHYTDSQCTFARLGEC